MTIKVNPHLANEVEEHLNNEGIEFSYTETINDGGMILDKYHIEEPTQKQVKFIESLPVQYLI